MSSSKSPDGEPPTATTGASVVRRAQQLADDVLFPNALSVDQAPLVPSMLLDEIAAAGLYGIAGPPRRGCAPAMSGDEFLGVVEALASGCLATTFVWMQHHSAVRALALAGGELADRWLEGLCAGSIRAGVAFASLRRPGPPMMRATPADGGGVRLDGEAPWVTGFGLVDVILIAARDVDTGAVVWSLIDAVAGAELSAQPLRLAAVNASSTVTMNLTGYVVPPGRVVAVEPFEEWQARDAAGLRTNGSLALGVASRAVRLLETGAGPRSELEAAVAAVRATLDGADVTGRPAARAKAAELALIAATTLMEARGGRSVLETDVAQLLARDAMFLLVFGQTQLIRTEQLAGRARDAVRLGSATGDW